MGKGYEGSEAKRKKAPHTFSIAASSYVEEEYQTKGLTALLYTTVFVALMVGLVYSVPRLFHLFTILDEQIPDKFMLAQIGSLGTLFGGVCLFFLRERKRMLYATLEMAFAIVMGGTAISRVKYEGDLGVWLAVAASAYLIVRGMENIQKAGFSIAGSWNRILTSRLVVHQGAILTDAIATVDESPKPNEPSASASI